VIHARWLRILFSLVVIALAAEMVYKALTGRI
jgi:uncharacterized membrane protein YfcA